MVGRDTPEPNARGECVRRNHGAILAEPRIPRIYSWGSVNCTSLPPTAEGCDERGFRCPGWACGRFRESIVTLAGATKPARAGIPHGMAIAVCQVRIAAL